MEAGYPDNPSPEDIAALEAEADEVVSYFENFGSEDAAALEKDDFYGGDASAEDAEEDVLDELDDLEAVEDPEDEGRRPAAALGGVTVAGPWAGASVPPVAAGASEVKAGVTVHLTAREFMRLSLGAAELGESAQELIVEAIEEYLDARGVLSLGGCSCLEALTKKPETVSIDVDDVERSRLGGTNPIFAVARRIGVRMHKPQRNAHFDEIVGALARIVRVFNLNLLNLAAHEGGRRRPVLRAVHIGEDLVDEFL